MSTRLNILYCVSLAVCSVQRMTQASFLHLAPSQIIAKIENSPQNGTAVPGDSPVKFHNDPANDLFRIETLDMYPNPCVLYVRNPHLFTNSSSNPKEPTPSLAHILFHERA